VRKTSIVALGALLAGTALLGAAPAKAAVHVSIGIPAPATECVEYRKHHHIRYAYCAEPEWSGEPVVIEGVTYREHLHWRKHNGHREFWVKGKWVVHD
jgi:hypothetical protein